MQHRAYLMRLKPGKAAKYLQCHQEEKIWPSVLSGLRKGKFNKMVILLHGRDAILFEEAENLKTAYQCCEADPESARWDRMIAEMMEIYPRFNQLKGDIEFVEIPVVFYFEKGKLRHGAKVRRSESHNETRAAK
jgi:L-rhamnose mutarotase